ncbi:LysR family transcriptional regulator [Agarilytica rhodophyticola]|uniref:LysR family transcriptional regulator n=1 Tax=Agarilytica rhodophyticola TaxID=1737490 RepID=UPI000B342711|nr:LysR family transcriptional regulator [Agarilytica rhodophyticola]
MDIESLKAFVHVARTGSFSSAAENLFITQPAVSKRIASLEGHLNHTLFDRLGKEVALTPAGQALLPSALKILQTIEDTERQIRERSGEIIGSLKVATSHHIGLHHLPPVLRTFASQYKNVNLQFEFLDSEQAHLRVLKGDCELAVVTLDPKLEKPLRALVLWRDPLCFVVANEHPLAKEPVLSLQQLSKEAAILPDLNTFTGRMVKTCFSQKNLPISLNMATNYLETIKMMVSVGLGWSVLPQTLVDEHMTVLHIPKIKLERQLGIVTHQKRSLGNAARAFIQALQDASTQTDTS